MVQAPLRMIQVSDTHIFGDVTRSLLGVNTQKSFDAILTQIKKDNPKIDFIIHSGDLTQDYSTPAYHCVADMLSKFDVPVYCIPGNHDDPKLMSTVYPRGQMKTDRQILVGNWQIILLDSHKPTAVEGYLGTDQLAFLERCLTEHPMRHTIVMFHHHPMPVGCAWLDNLGLKNADEMWKIIINFHQIKTVLFGHVHQQFEMVYQGIPCFSTPSTCFQFMRKQDQFGLEHLPQGYRWVDLHDDGRFDTGVVRLAEYVGKFDQNAKGY